MFLPCSTNEADYEIELLNFALLNHLKYQNIVELLSAYTYRNQHNLIFPLAKEGDLGLLLKSKRPPEFRSTMDFLVALSELSSAIEQVHNLFTQSPNISMIGCHHDPKPGNILVDNGTFLLADFGLSRFKSSSQNSSTLHRRGQGDYLAPECEDLDGNFEKHRVKAR